MPKKIRRFVENLFLYILHFYPQIFMKTQKNESPQGTAHKKTTKMPFPLLVHTFSAAPLEKQAKDEYFPENY